MGQSIVSAVESDTKSKPIDQGSLLARCMGNVSFALSLLGELEATGEQQVEGIANHAATGDHLAAAEAAHGLKGAAAIIAAEPLRSVSRAIEAAGEAGDLATVTLLVDDLRQEMARWLAALPAIREEVRKFGS